MERVSFRLPSDVKAWYAEEAKSLGMSMASLLAYILTTHQRTQDNSKVIKKLVDLSSSDEVKKVNREVIEVFNTPEFKQLLNQSSKDD